MQTSIHIYTMVATKMDITFNTMFQTTFLVILATAWVGSAFDTSRANTPLFGSVRAVDRRHNAKKEMGHGGMMQQRCCNMTTEMHRPGNSSMRNMSAEETACITEVQTKYNLKENLAEHGDSNFSTCFMECIFKKKNLTDSNGNITKAATDFAAKALHITDTGILGNITAICPSANEDGMNTMKFSCSRIPSLFLRCAQDMIDLYCPSKQQVTQGKCKEHLASLKKKYA